MVYKWKSGAGFPVTAQTAGKVIESLGDRVTPEALVDSAKPIDSPIHNCFEWNNKVAAHQHRLSQASRMLRSLVTVEVHVERFEPDDTPPREVVVSRPAYVSIGNSVGRSTYTTTARAMSDKELRAQVLSDALTQLRGWRRRFSHLKELAEVFKAIDRLDVPVAVKV